MIRRLRTIDAHVAGEPLRLIIEGFPRPVGQTMLEKREWLRRRHDRLRRALMHEPRGHRDMYGAVLTEPVTEGSHAGVLFMHHEGYSTMCGHGVIGVVTIALERGLLTLSDWTAEIRLDTPAGLVKASVNRNQGSGARDQEIGTVRSVSFTNVPSFVLKAGLAIKAGKRSLVTDVVFGGAFYAIVDSEAAGIPLRSACLPELLRLAGEIKVAVERALPVVHPLERGLNGIYGTIFTSVANAPGADLRNATVFADGQVDRSPCGTGTAAIMAVLASMGLLAADRPFVNESLIGTLFTGRVVGRTSVGDLAAIVPELEGSAWITGEHTFYVHEEDPFRDGFLL